MWRLANGKLIDSTFINNTAGTYGGAVMFNNNAANCILTGSIFINNCVNNYGGAVAWMGTNGLLNNSTFINNAAGKSSAGYNRFGGAILWQGSNGHLNCSKFSGNTANLGGAVCWWTGANGTITTSKFNNNYATTDGGAIYLDGANSNMSDCNFTNNHASYGDNVYWSWTVDEFLNKYEQIHDYDYVYIKNSEGTPSKTIVLNKKGVIISGQSSTNVIFDAKGGNVHFEVTGEGILIEKITFRNFNFTGNGGAIDWTGNYGALKNCNFINNTANAGGGIDWRGVNGTISGSSFTNNNANYAGGAIFWENSNGILSYSTFTGNNIHNYGGAVCWNGPNGIVIDSTFKDNIAIYHGGAIFFNAVNCTLSGSTFINNTVITYGGGAVSWTNTATKGTLTTCTFINNTALGNDNRFGGGAIYWQGFDGILTDSNFAGNTATYGGAIFWYSTGSMANCTFNNKWIKSNGIYVLNSLNINNGNGIVELTTYNTAPISGVSIVILNNETYYYPPNSNINLPNKIINKNFKQVLINNSDERKNIINN